MIVDKEADWVNKEEWIEKLRAEKNIAMWYEEFRDRILSNLPKQRDKEVEIKYRIIANEPWWECPNCFVFNMCWDKYCRMCGSKIKRVN